MGTSANIIIKFKSKKITLYNHHDSYFSCLGIKMIKDLIRLLDENTINEIIEKFDTHIIIDESYEKEYNKKYETKLLNYINIETFTYLEDDIIKIYKKYKGLKENESVNKMFLKEKYLHEIKISLDKNCCFHKYLIKELFKCCYNFKNNPYIYLIKYTCNDNYIYSIYKVFKHEYIYVEHCNDIDYEYVIDFNKKIFTSEEHGELEFDKLKEFLEKYFKNS